MREVEIKMENMDDTAKDVFRCLRVLYGTRVGEAALDRDFGLDWDFLDMPTETAKALLSAEIIKKTKKYEPRAKITEITYGHDSNGLFMPRVKVSVINE